MVPKLSMKPIHSVARYFTYFTYLMKFVLCVRKYSKRKWVPAMPALNVLHIRDARV